MRGLAVAAGVLCAASVFAGQVVVKDGERLAFFGDSITAGGACELNGGYCRLVVAGLEANGIHVTPIWAGVCGDQAPHLYKRLGPDILEQKADVVCLNIGVNDVSHMMNRGFRNHEADVYESNLRAILKATKEANIRTVLVTPTMLGEMPRTPKNVLVDRCCGTMRSLAREFRLPLGDANAEMKASLQRLFDARPKGCARRMFFEKDSVHMWREGFVVLAIATLKGLGLDEAQLKTAGAYWIEKGKVKPEVLAGVLGDFSKPETRDHWFPMLSAGGRVEPPNRLAWIRKVTYTCDANAATQIVAHVTVESKGETHLDKEAGEIAVSVLDENGVVAASRFYAVALKPGTNHVDVPLRTPLRLDPGPASAPRVYVMQTVLTAPGEWGLGWGEKHDVYPAFPLVLYAPSRPEF